MTHDEMDQLITNIGRMLRDELDKERKLDYLLIVSERHDGPGQRAMISNLVPDDQKELLASAYVQCERQYIKPERTIKSVKNAQVIDLLKRLQTKLQNEDKDDGV